ncbi:hypothetical protein R1flu_000738 [Riccia fluitans]|uniref:Cyclin-like domain-containing protein n=1 Tax=Riccia fluitans TaxID=41844 RepID=A0ABD1Y194_9MARC
MCVYEITRGGGRGRVSCQRSKKSIIKAKSRRSGRLKLLICRESVVTTSNLQTADLLCAELLPGLDSENCHPALAAVNEIMPPLGLTVKTTAAASVLLNSPLPRCLISDVICSQAELLSKHLISGDNGSSLNFGPECSESDAHMESDDSEISSSFDCLCPSSGSNSDIGSGQVQSPWSRESERPQTSSNSSFESQFPLFEFRFFPYERTESESEDGASSSNSLPAARKCELMSCSTTARFCEITGSLLERETETCYQLPKLYIEKLMQNPCTHTCGVEQNELRATRRRIVIWIFQVVRLLGLGFLAAAHAVSILDRYLSNSLFSTQQGKGKTNIPLAATACVWIAAKLEDTSAADRYLPSIRGLSLYEFDEGEIRQMEVAVLKCLGWRMLGATACDFLATMIAQLPAFGLPSHLLQPVGDRSEQIIQGILSGNISGPPFDNRCVPTHTAASMMEAFCLALKIDVV